MNIYEAFVNLDGPVFVIVVENCPELVLSIKEWICAGFYHEGLDDKGKH